MENIFHFLSSECIVIINLFVRNCTYIESKSNCSLLNVSMNVRIFVTQPGNVSQILTTPVKRPETASVIQLSIITKPVSKYLLTILNIYQYIPNWWKVPAPLWCFPTETN